MSDFSASQHSSGLAGRPCLLQEVNVNTITSLLLFWVFLFFLLQKIYTHIKFYVDQWRLSMNNGVMRLMAFPVGTLKELIYCYFFLLYLYQHNRSCGSVRISLWMVNRTKQFSASCCQNTLLITPCKRGQIWDFCQRPFLHDIPSFNCQSPWTGWMAGPHQEQEEIPMPVLCQTVWPWAPVISMQWKDWKPQSEAQVQNWGVGF